MFRFIPRIKCETVMAENKGLRYSVKMNWTPVFVSLLGSLGAGALLGFLLKKIADKSLVRRAQTDAEDLLGEIRDQVETEDEVRQQRTQEIQLQLWSKVEKDFLNLEEKIEDLTEVIEEKKQKTLQSTQDKQALLKEDEEELKRFEEIVKSAESKLNSIRQRNNDLRQNLTQKLLERTQAQKEQVIESLAQEIINETEARARRFVEDSEVEVKNHAEMKAKRILDIAIDRFARPYCPERGIGAVEFPDANSRKFLTDRNGENLKAITEATGCDIIVRDEMEMIGVAGFDPVRRELTRRLLERLMKEKRPYSPEFVKKMAENQKKELFNQIKRDGDQIAKELRMEGLHPEIRQMMGSLRYRYSFTQNQYFHCGEVGWLGGLLAAELGIDVKKARRSGLLHDIGKSMDHAMEGGHAVIGADFIAARGEAADVVHNVRAHHHDETPSTPHAYLVIASDAISGARPGARRSTIESYNQKVTDLQDIARSFEGVTDCIVLSGGRECRVSVNGRQVDDRKSLDLAQKIAKRIEDELSYPGQIKVVVVRETIVSESTKSLSAS